MFSGKRKRGRQVLDPKGVVAVGQPTEKIRYPSVGRGR